MNWNDGYERKKFFEKQKKQNEEYRSLGMSEEAIREINEFDFEVYKSNRVNAMHTQSLDLSVFYESTCDESDNALLEKFGDRISVTMEVIGGFPRYWWIEGIDNPELAAAVKALSKEEIELLTLYAFDEKTEEEIAKQLGITQQSVS